MSAERKPTPAQRKWLQVIEAGNVVRLNNSWAEGLLARSSWRKSTFAMTMALHNAGWIDAEHAQGTFNLHRIYLTDAGRAAIGLPAPQAAQKDQPSC